MLCELASRVGREVYGNKIPTDCFCDSRNKLQKYPQVSPEVVAFIINATVKEIHERETE